MQDTQYLNPKWWRYFVSKLIQIIKKIPKNHLKNDSFL